ACCRAEGVATPEAVSPEQIRSWIDILRDQGLAPPSIRRARSAARTYFAFLLAEGVLAADPTEHIQAPRAGRKLPDHLSLDEVARLLDAPDPDHALYWRDRAILELLYASGIRVSELADLGLPALELDEGFATVFGKGSRERLVPVGGPALGALGRYLREVRPRLDTGGGKGRVL